MTQNKKFKTLLLDGLICSDFLFLNKNLKNKNRHLKSLYNINNETALYLDPMETLKSIKQFIRILQFFKKQKKKFLHVLLKNKQYSKIIQTFLKDSDLNLSCSIKESISRDNTLLPNDQLLLILDSINNDHSFFKKLFDKNIFLINKINSKIEQNNWGTYKIYNDLNDFKKLIFIFVLMDLILKNKN